jgi:hypothetical protein
MNEPRSGHVRVQPRPGALALPDRTLASRIAGGRCTPSRPDRLPWLMRQVDAEGSNLRQSFS